MVATDLCGNSLLDTAIEYRRGTVSVLNAELLEQSACECYQSSKSAFEAALSGRETT